jgi:hypothetical protein
MRKDNCEKNNLYIKKLIVLNFYKNYFYLKKNSLFKKKIFDYNLFKLKKLKIQFIFWKIKKIE